MAITQLPEGFEIQPMTQKSSASLPEGFEIQPMAQQQSPQEEPNFFERTAASYNKRTGEAQRDALAGVEGRQSMPEAYYNMAGQGAGFIGDVGADILSKGAGAFINATTSPEQKAGLRSISEFLGRNVAEPVGQAHKALSAKYPRAMKAADSTANILGLPLAVAPVKTAKAIVKTAAAPFKAPGAVAELAASGAEKALSKVSPKYAAKLEEAQAVEGMTGADKARRYGSQVFQESDALGGGFHARLTNDTVRDIESIIPTSKTAGVELFDDAAVAAKSLKDFSQYRNKPLTMQGLKDLDERIGAKIQAIGIDKTTFKYNGVGQKLVEAQDKMRERFLNAKDKEVFGKGKEAVKKLDEARKAWSASFAIDDIERIERAAELSTNQAAARRAGYKALAMNKKRFKKYSKEEQKLIEKGAKGGAVSDALRSGIGNRIISTLGGAAIGGMGGAAAGMAAGKLARGAADALEPKVGKALNESILNRSGIKK